MDNTKQKNCGKHFVNTVSLEKAFNCVSMVSTQGNNEES